MLVFGHCIKLVSRPDAAGRSEFCANSSDSRALLAHYLLIEAFLSRCRSRSGTTVGLCGPSRQHLVVSQMHLQSAGKSARVTSPRLGYVWRKGYY